MNPIQVLLHSSGWIKEPGANEELIRSTEIAIGRELPSDYKEFVRLSNGGYGQLSSSYLKLWDLDNLEGVKEEVDRYMKDMLVIGSDGGPIWFGLKGRGESCRMMFMFVGDLDEEIVYPIGDSFSEGLDFLMQTSENDFYLLTLELSKKSV